MNHMPPFPAYDPHAAPVAMGDIAGVQGPETVSMVTTDGTRLDADVYRPEGDGPWPVLLQRQAYGRRIGCTICYAHPAWYAARGYLVVVQDVRGRGTSEGRFWPGRHEAQDGAETVEWAARLPGSDGRVAMYGFSYQAYDQLLAATGDCPSLAALIPAMGPFNPVTTWIFDGGAWALDQMAGWGVQITAEGARRATQAPLFTALKSALPTLFDGETSAQPAPLMASGAIGHYPDWMSRDADDPTWDAMSPAAMAGKIRARNLPMLFIGGWFDGHIASTLDAFRNLDRDGDATLRLLVGPWVHFPWGRRVAGVDLGPEAALDTDRAQIAFLDAVLKDKGDLDPANRVQLFDLGTRTWTGAAALPVGQTASYLAGTGRASTRIGDGSLADRPAAGTELLLHDPWRTAPVAGPRTGPHDRRIVDERSDVMTFDTGAQGQPVTLCGPVDLTLAVTADRPSFDLSATLSVVKSDGAVRPVASAYLHNRTAPSVPVRLRSFACTPSTCRNSCFPHRR